MIVKKLIIKIITIILLPLVYQENDILNDIIIVGENEYRYVNFETTPYGEMFLETYSYQDMGRIFYGINKDGSGYFNNSANDKVFIFKTYSAFNKRADSELGYFKVSDENKEIQYDILVSFSDNFTEFYTYKNQKSLLFYIITEEFLPVLNISKTYIWSSNTLKEGNINYYLLAFISNYTIESNTLFYYNILKINFILKDNAITPHINSKRNFFTSDKKATSCYITEKNYILCFYYCYIKGKNKDGEIIESYKLYELACMNTFLDLLNVNYYENVEEKKIYFYKAIYIREEIGCIVYYISDFIPPSLRFVEYDNSDNSFKEYIFNTTLSNYYYFNSYLKLNDLIKINNYSVCFISSSNNKEELIIAMINLYDYYEYIIRYYLIKIFNLKKLKFFYEIRANLYNQFLAFAASICYNNLCNSEENEHFSALIFFSYPNYTDWEFNLIDYLNNSISEDTTFNISEHAIIDNNIFGYEISGVYILNICNELNFKIKEAEKIVKSNSIVLKNESILIILEEEYDELECKIDFQIIAGIPNIEKYNSYTDRIYSNLTGNDDDYLENNIFYGRIGHFKITIDQEITTKCDDELCNYCLEDNKDCISCENRTYFKISPLGQKLCLKYKEEEVTNNETCTIEEIIQNNCTQHELNDEQIKKVYNLIKKTFLKKNYTQEVTIITKNVIFEIGESDQLKIIKKSILSSLDLGDCEIKLKRKYNISDNEPLIIYKIDIKSPDYLTTNVQYEVYQLNTQNQLDLTICSEDQINLYVPVNLDSSTESLYESLNNSGYNLFDSNDSFYNDICTRYTTENKTDIIIPDRQNILYQNNGNLNLCQENCSLEEYSITTKKVRCLCGVQKEKNLTSTIDSITFLRTSIFYGFIVTITNSNFMVLKCFKLIFDIPEMFYNIGFIIMTIILLLSVILMIYEILTLRKRIRYYIDLILKDKLHFSKIKQENSKINNNKKMTTEIPIQKKRKLKTVILTDIPAKKELKINNTVFKTENGDGIKFKRRNKIFKTEIMKKTQFKRREKRTKTHLDKIHSPTKKSILKKNRIYTNNKKANKSKKVNISNQISKNTIININFNSNNSSSYSNLNLHKSNYTKDKLNLDRIQVNNLDNNNDINYQKGTIKKKYLFHPLLLNDTELNTLEYKKAIEVDKRSYFEYYWCLLKKKQILLFTFIPSNDYNLMSIKISLLLISFSLYLSLVGFFYNDNTMHNIYIHNGTLNILYRIPQIFFSTIITVIINAVLKQLALTEQSIILIKQESTIKMAIEKYKEISKCFKIKFPIFFILNIIFIIFFWYFLSCFCAIYINTQYLLIRDALSSFLLSMTYPLGFSLLPGLFRIPSLNAKNKNKECLYKFSNFLSII